MAKSFLFFLPRIKIYCPLNMNLFFAGNEIQKKIFVEGLWVGIIK